MVIVIPISENGEDLSTAQYNLTLKQGQTSTIIFMITKDVISAAPWNLTNFTKSFIAKEGIIDATPVLNITNNHSGWDVSNASLGILKLSLRPENLSFNKTVLGQLILSQTSPEKVLKSDLIIIDVLKTLSV